MENNLEELQNNLQRYKKTSMIFALIEVICIFLVFFNLIFALMVIIAFIIYLFNYLKAKEIKKEIDKISLKKNSESKIGSDEFIYSYINNDNETEVKEELEDIYIKSFNNVPKYDLNKELDDKYFKSLLRTKEVDYDIFVKYPNTTKKPYDFVVLDFETTGLNPVNDEIIQIGAIKFEYYEPVEIFSTYVKPNKKIPKRITQINSITNETVENSPNIEDVLPKLLDFIGDSYIVAHNAPFDMSFLLNNLYRYNFKKPKNKAIDTLKLSRCKLREYDFEKDKEVKLKTYKLEELKCKFNLWNLDSHDALSDCKVCAYVYMNIIKQYGDTYCLY